MMTATSTNDILFFLHHCNIDRLWAMWQTVDHQGIEFYPDNDTNEEEGHKINDIMWPWVGSTPGYQPVGLPSDIVLPDYSNEPERRVRNVMSHRDLGYEYEMIL